MTVSIAVNDTLVNHEEACCFREKKRCVRDGIFRTIRTLAATDLENKCKLR